MFPQPIREGTFENAKFSISNGNEFVYEYAGETIKVSYVMSAAPGNTKRVTNYTKYGTGMNISFFVPSGFYLMSNNGVLTNYGGNITDIKVLMGANTAKIMLTF